MLFIQHPCCHLIDSCNYPSISCHLAPSNALHCSLSLSSCRGVCMLAVNHPLTPKSLHLFLEWTVDGDIEWLQYAS